MLTTEDEIKDLKNFVEHLNSMKDSAVIVEGKRDAIALKKIGVTGNIIEFHKFCGMINFVDSVAKHQNVIILFDGDRKGRYLTEKTIQLLQRRTKIDLTFKKRLTKITKGKIRFIEQLVCFEYYLV